MDRGPEAQRAFVTVREHRQRATAPRKGVCARAQTTTHWLLMLYACCLLPAAWPAPHPVPVQEAVRLHQLRHPHVVSFVGVAVSDGKGVLLMELCEGRDLHSALPLSVSAGASLTASGSVGRGDRPFGWYRRGRSVACDVARGLNYLHSHNVVHMDIKSSVRTKPAASFLACLLACFAGFVAPVRVLTQPSLAWPSPP